MGAEGYRVKEREGEKGKEEDPSERAIVKATV